MKYPYEETAIILAKGAIEGARAFLSAICLPAAEEFGLLVKDRVNFWRTRNTIRIAEKAERLLQNVDLSNRSAPPRIVMEIVDKGSWSSEDYIQDYWAGLLASSVSVDGEDDSNLLFTDILGRLSKIQVKILNYSCETADKYHSHSGWIFADGVSLSLQGLVDLTGVNDVHRIDRELDFLREVGLILRGFSPDGTDADISPTALALQMYVRCQGYVGSPTDYFQTKGADPQIVEQKWILKREQKHRESQKDNSA